MSLRNLPLAVPGVLATVALVGGARRASAGERVRGLRSGSRWRLPEWARSRLGRALAEAEVRLEPEEVCELGLGAMVGLAAVVGALSPGLLVLGVPAMIIGGPVALGIARRRAARQFARALPGALEQVAAGLRGGGGLGETLDLLVTEGGPLAGDLRRVTTRASLGLGLAEALGTWPDDRPLPAVRAVAGALALATTVGGPAADALDGLAASLRERLGAVAEARALSAQARLSALVVGAAPLLYLAFAALLDPGSIEALVGTSTGRVCLVVGLVLEGVAILWMRWIVGDEDTA